MRFLNKSCCSYNPSTPHRGATHPRQSTKPFTSQFISTYEPGGCTHLSSLAVILAIWGQLIMEAEWHHHNFELFKCNSTTMTLKIFFRFVKGYWEKKNVNKASACTCFNLEFHLVAYTLASVLSQLTIVLT